MSPLACSLLSLAALLAAAEAQPCSTIMIGQQSPIYVNAPIQIPPGGGRIFGGDYCAQHYGVATVGLSVQACNNDPYGMPPTLQPTNYMDPTQPVDALCPDACPYGGSGQVVQYCACTNCGA